MKAEAYGLGGCDSSTVVAVKMLKGDQSQVFFTHDFALFQHISKLVE